MNRAYIALIASIALFIVAVSVYVARRPSPPAPYSAATCVPATGDLCPTDQWYADWQRLQELNSEIAKDQQAPAIAALQDKIDRSLGLSQRLRQMIPQGYEWSVEKKRFVASKPATPPPTPATTPTPVAPVTK